MRKLLCVLFPVLLVFSAVACAKEPTYQDGWNDGFEAGSESAYWEGYEDAEEFWEVYDEPWDDHVCPELEDPNPPLWEIEENASWHASRITGLSAYEAAQEIALYLDGDPYVTREDFLIAAETMYYFYDYIETHK